jgi:hypothetical protein
VTQAGTSESISVSGSVSGRASHVAKGLGPAHWGSGPGAGPTASRRPGSRTHCQPEAREPDHSDAGDSESERPGRPAGSVARRRRGGGGPGAGLVTRPRPLTEAEPQAAGPGVTLSRG